MAGGVKGVAGGVRSARGMRGVVKGCDTLYLKTAIVV